MEQIRPPRRLLNVIVQRAQAAPILLTPRRVLVSQTAYWPPVFREDFSDQLQPRFEPQLQSLDRFHRPHKLCLQMLTTALVSQLLQFNN